MIQKKTLSECQNVVHCMLSHLYEVIKYRIDKIVVVELSASKASFTSSISDLVNCLSQSSVSEDIESIPLRSIF